MQCRGRMIHSNHKTVADFSHLPMDLGNLRSLEKQAHGETPEGDNDARIDNLNLVLKIIARASFDFIGQGIAIPWRAAFDHVRDPDIGARHASLFKQLIQKFSCCADERTSLLIFMETWSLTNKHDLSMCRSFARDCFFARTMEFALGTNHDLLCKFG